MKETNRSLLFAMLACVCMGLLATPLASPFLFLVAFALSAIGFRIGFKAARQQGRVTAWLATGINALTFIALMIFLVLITEALKENHR